MKALLIIMVLSNGAWTGTTITQAKFPTMEDCYVALKAVRFNDHGERAAMAYCKPDTRGGGDD